MEQRQRRDLEEPETFPKALREEKRVMVGFE
jgi:hypothetical protein